MKAELVERREVYVRCPRCGDEESHKITRLSSGARFGISYCQKCGVGIEGYMTDGAVEIRVADEGKDVSYVLLRVNPEETPIFLMVRPAGAKDGGIFLDVDLRQIATVRPDDLPEALRSIKYVVKPSSEKGSATEE